jgi:hypothetical protein
MHSYFGHLEGRHLAAEKPIIVLGWPLSSSICSFDSKIAAWNYVEAAARHDRLAIFARVYEHTQDHWHRIPSLPTYLQKLEEARASLREPQEQLVGSRATGYLIIGLTYANSFRQTTKS